MLTAATLLAAPVMVLALSALEPPAITAKASESKLTFILPPTRVESVCNGDLFAIETHTQTGLIAWVCLRADAVSGRLDVADWGYLDGIQGTFVRGPVANDRGVIFAVDQNFVRVDPLTLQQTVIGTMSPHVDTINAATIIDVPPGVANAVLLDTSLNTELRTFPGGQYLRDVIIWPQSANWAREPVGHFLSNTTSLVAVHENDGSVNLIHPDTGAIAQSFPNVAFGNWARVAVRSAAGIDSMMTITGQYGEQISVDRFAPWASTSLGSSADGFVITAAPVDWTAGEHDVVGMWDYALRVFDPATMSVRHEELIPYTRIFPQEAWLFAVDADGDGLQEVFWTDYSGLYSLPHNGSSRELQSPSVGFQVAGISGTTLVTAETTGTFGDENLQIVFRDARTLEVKSRRTASPEQLDSQLLTGSVPGQDQPVLFTLTTHRLAAENLADGTPMWTLDNPFPYANDWTAFALPTGSCAPDSCARLLIASNAANTDSQGSFLWLVDAASGKTLWQSVPEGGLGGGEYRAIALADITGDGVPDLIGARNNAPAGWLVEAIDGATFQALWSKDLGNAMPQALGVSSKGSVRVALLLEGGAELLDPGDGHTLASQPVVTDIYANCCTIKYDAFVFGEGIWVILGGEKVQWLDADFANPVQSIDARGVSTEVSRGRGALFAAGVEGVYRIQFLRDDVFMDEMEE